MIVSALCFLPKSVKAQSVRDSLLTVYQSDGRLTERIDAANQLFLQTYRKNIAEAAGYVDFMLEGATSIDYATGLVNGNYGKGIVAFLQGQFEEALTAYDQAIFYAQKTNIDPMKIWSGKASVYLVTGKLDTAITLYQKAIVHFDSTKNYKEGLRATNNLAVIYSRSDQYQRALEMYQQCYEIAEILEDSITMGRVLTNIGNSYFDLGNDAEAIKYLLRALKIAEARGDERGQSVTLNTIGQQYLETQQPKQALVYLKKALVLKKNQSLQPSYARTLMFLGRAQLELDNAEAATQNLKEAIEILTNLKDLLVLADAHYFLATIYLRSNRTEAGIQQLKIAEEMALDNEKREVLAKIYLQYARLFNENGLASFPEFQLDVGNILSQAEAYVEETDDLKGKKEVYTAKANWLAEQRQFESALNYYQKAQTIKDSLYSSEQISTLTAMRTQFETEQKEQENELLLVKNKLANRRNQQYLIGFILALLVACGLGYLAYQLKRTKDDLATQKQTIELQNQELSALNETKDRFFSIIAHDLRSPIAAFQGIGTQINYFLKKEAYDRLATLGLAINQSSAQLNNLLDNLLNWSLTQTGNIPYRPKRFRLLDLVEEVGELYRGALQQKELDLSVSIAEEVQVFADERAISTVVRNLLNNAIKFSEKSNPIKVVADQLNDYVVLLSVQDFGVGMSPAQTEHLFKPQLTSRVGTSGERGTGLGLLLCKELLVVNKGYIAVESEVGKGTQFVVTLPTQ